MQIGNSIRNNMCMVHQRLSGHVHETVCSNLVEIMLCMTVTSQKRKPYVSCGATAAVLVFGFCSCWPLLCQALAHTGLAAVAAGRYSGGADRCSGPESPVHS